MKKPEPSVQIKATRYQGGGVIDVKMRGHIYGKDLADALANIIEHCWDIADEQDRARDHPTKPRIVDMIREHWRDNSDGDYCQCCGHINVLCNTCERCGSDDVVRMEGEL